MNTSITPTPPTVSVIIPVYNHAHRIDTAIHSVLAQSYQNYEIIVVNDGSSDNLKDVLQQFKSIKLINHDRNLGRATARNTGIRAARGEYIAFLDADDYWLPTKLTQQIVFFEEREDIAICLTGYEMLMPDGRRHQMPSFQEEMQGTYLLEYMSLPDGSVPMIRRLCFDKIGLQDTALEWHENLDWFIRAVRGGYKTGYIAESLCIKTKSQKHPPTAITETATIYLIKEYANFFISYGLAGRSAMSIKWFDLASFFFHERKWRKGIYYLLKAAIIWPLTRPGLYIRLLDALLGTDIETFVLSSHSYKFLKGIKK